MATSARRDLSRQQGMSMPRDAPPGDSTPSPTVLIVDDEAHLRLLYEVELKRCGFATLAAADGPRCLDNLVAMSIDLVILDIRMPGMDGIDLLARIRGLDRSIPVVINTAYSGYADNFLTWSADAFVVKSSDLSELVETVLRLVGRRAR